MCSSFTVLGLSIISFLLLIGVIIFIIYKKKKREDLQDLLNKREDLKNSSIVALVLFFLGIFPGIVGFSISNSSGCDSLYAGVAGAAASLNGFAFVVLGIFSCISLRES